MFIGMLFGYSVVFALLLAVACKAEWKQKYYILAKTMCSLAFVVILFISGSKSEDSWQFGLMLPAFFCCMAGDVLMAAYNRYRKRVYFIIGLLIFLAGHLFFARWLCRLQQLDAIDFLIPILAMGLAWALMSQKNIHTGRLRPFILIYAFFVALFFSKGIHLAVTDFSVPNLMIAVGSGLFFASDVSILFLYFYKSKGRKVHVFNLATYYYGVFLLASNLLFL